MKEARRFIGGAADGQVLHVDPKVPQLKLVIREVDDVKFTAARWGDKFTTLAFRCEEYEEFPVRVGTDFTVMMMKLTSMTSKEALCRLVAGYNPSVIVKGELKYRLLNTFSI